LGRKIIGMKEITVQELKELQDSGADFQLIDVREPHEYDYCNLNGELIPQGEIPDNVDKIDRNKKVIIHCRSGVHWRRLRDQIIFKRDFCHVPLGTKYR
jgi:rhodanese-related sulfurtransferase